jgi:hypothetical protein
MRIFIVLVSFIAILLIQFSCKNAEALCTAYPVAHYDRDSLLYIIQPPLPEPLEISESDEGSYHSKTFYDFGDTVIENYWNPRDGDKTRKADIGILMFRKHRKELDFGFCYPEIVVSDTVGLSSYFGAWDRLSMADTIYNKALLENRVTLDTEKESRIKKWINYDQSQRSLGIEIYDKVYILDSASCLNCEFYIDFQLDPGWTNFPDFYLFNFKESRFLFIRINDGRLSPWFWIFDITDSTNIKYFGFEEAAYAWYDQINDFNDDGYLDVAVIQPGCANSTCNACDTSAVLADSIDIKSFGCQQMSFYTYRNGKMEPMTDKAGAPYYVNLLFAHWTGPFRPLSRHLWKDIKWEGDHYMW